MEIYIAGYSNGDNITRSLVINRILKSRVFKLRNCKDFLLFIIIKIVLSIAKKMYLEIIFCLTQTRNMAFILQNVI